MGMHQALEEANIKHTIVGIDIRDMPDYPFEFVKADILKMGYINYNYFDFIWTSPPCQAFTTATKQLRNKGKKYPNLIDFTRTLLLNSEKPFVIENTELAPIRRDLLLCGTMFNLGVFRHRIFEVHNFYCPQPIHPSHNGYVGDGKYFTIISGGAFRFKEKKEKRKKIKNYNYGNYDSWSKAMGIDWIPLDYIDEKSRKSREVDGLGPVLCSKHPLTEAIPPAYSKFIMNQFLMKHLTLMDFLEVL